MGARAEERAKERSRRDRCQHYTAVTDYLVESLANPGAYVVEGYKNEMAVVYAPPISLSLNEIKAVVSYLTDPGRRSGPGGHRCEQPSEIAAKAFYSKHRGRRPRPAAATRGPVRWSSRTTAGNVTS